MLAELYPSQVARFDGLKANLGFNPAPTTTDPRTPEGVGNVVAEALMSFRRNDGSNQLNNYVDTTGYVPVNTADVVTDPSRWQPIGFANGATPGFIAPHWF